MAKFFVSVLLFIGMVVYKTSAALRIPPMVHLSFMFGIWGGLFLGTLAGFTFPLWLNALAFLACFSTVCGRLGMLMLMSDKGGADEIHRYLGNALASKKDETVELAADDKDEALKAIAIIEKYANEYAEYATENAGKVSDDIIETKRKELMAKANEEIKRTTKCKVVSPVDMQPPSDRLN